LGLTLASGSETKKKIIFFSSVGPVLTFLFLRIWLFSLVCF